MKKDVFTKVDSAIYSSSIPHHRLNVLKTLSQAQKFKKSNPVSIRNSTNPFDD